MVGAISTWDPLLSKTFTSRYSSVYAASGFAAGMGWVATCETNSRTRRLVLSAGIPLASASPISHHSESKARRHAKKKRGCQGFSRHVKNGELLHLRQPLSWLMGSSGLPTRFLLQRTSRPMRLAHWRRISRDAAACRPWHTTRAPAVGDTRAGLRSGLISVDYNCIA